MPVLRRVELGLPSYRERRPSPRKHWRWACDHSPRPGSRRVLPLSEHLRELIAFCRRVASPLPTWDRVLLLDTSDPRVHCDQGWTVPNDVLVGIAEFAPRFEALLLMGYAWVNLPACRDIRQ